MELDLINVKSISHLLTSQINIQANENIELIPILGTFVTKQSQIQVSAGDPIYPTSNGEIRVTSTFIQQGEKKIWEGGLISAFDFSVETETLFACIGAQLKVFKDGIIIKELNLKPNYYCKIILEYGIAFLYTVDSKLIVIKTEPNLQILKVIDIPIDDSEAVAKPVDLVLALWENTEVEQSLDTTNKLHYVKVSPHNFLHYIYHENRKSKKLILRVAKIYEIDILETLIGDFEDEDMLKLPVCTLLADIIYLILAINADIDLNALFEFNLKLKGSPSTKLKRYQILNNLSISIQRKRFDNLLPMKSEFSFEIYSMFFELLIEKCRDSWTIDDIGILSNYLTIPEFMNYSEKIQSALVSLSIDVSGLAPREYQCILCHDLVVFDSFHSSECSNGHVNSTF